MTFFSSGVWLVISTRHGNVTAVTEAQERPPWLRVAASKNHAGRTDHGQSD